MNYLLLITGIFVLVIIIVAIFFVFNSRMVSIEYLKSKGRFPEIIDIFLNEKADINRRREALSVLVEMATPEIYKAIVSGLTTRSSSLLSQLVIEIPKIGAPIYPYLVKAFSKPYSRPGVIRVLAALGQNAGQVLAPLFKDPNLVLRNASIQALDQLGWKPGKDAIGIGYWITKRHPEKCAEIGAIAVPELIEALKDPGLCRGAVEALAEIGDTSAGWPLINLGKNPQQKVRVIKALARWRGDAIPLLSEAIFSDDPQVQEIVLYTLDLINWEPTLDEMGARYWALKRNWSKLIEMGTLAVPSLMELLDEKDHETRKNVIKSIGVIGNETALEKLLANLDDPDIEIRKAVINALGRFKNIQAINALINMLADDEIFPDVIVSLIKIGKAGINPLIQALSHHRLNIRSRAADVLERIGWNPETDFEKTVFWIARQDWNQCIQIGAAAVDMLVKELSNEQNCINVAQALVKIGEPRAVDPMIKAFSGKPGQVQKEMARIIGSMGAPVVEPLLLELGKGQVDLVPVIYALGETGDVRCAQPLTELLKEIYPTSVREVAANALGKIGLPAVDSIFEVLKGEGVNPRAAGIALGEAAKTIPERLISALKTREFDAQVLIYALGKIPEEDTARAILGAMQSVQYGQEIRTTAQDALFEIGTPAIQPIIDHFIRSPEDHNLYSSMLIRFGDLAVEPLIWTMQNCYNPLQCEAIINIIGDIGDVRAVNPLVDILKRHNINGKLVNAALDKIWKKQRWEKERSKNKINQG